MANRGIHGLRNKRFSVFGRAQCRRQMAMRPTVHRPKRLQVGQLLSTDKDVFSELRNPQDQTHGVQSESESSRIFGKRMRQYTARFKNIHNFMFYIYGTYINETKLLNNGLILKVQIKLVRAGTNLYMIELYNKWTYK